MNPRNIVIDGNTVVPGIPPLTVDGAILSADPSRNLFADGTTTLTATPTAQISETITIITDTFVINPKNIVLDGNTVVPDAVTMDEEAISADASEDQSTGGTQMLAGPSSLTSSTSLASSTTQIYETITQYGRIRRASNCHCSRRYPFSAWRPSRDSERRSYFG